MSSVSEYFALVLLAMGATAVRGDGMVERGPDPAETTRPALRVCADPNNLPFSNERGEGFENALARLMARDLGRELAYTWWPQRRGFIRKTLASGRCDLVMGVPAQFELAHATRPYYRSTYVFVTRAASRLDITSFDDPRLRTLRIGLHAIGDDYANVPPAQELAARGLVDHIVGYTLYGDYSQPDPPRRLIDAVANGDVDVAIAWGPLAGYFARRARVPLRIEPIDATDTHLPMAFDISMGLRRDDASLAADVEAFIAGHAPEIDALLRDYGVPIVPTDAPHEARNAASRSLARSIEVSQ